MKGPDVATAVRLYYEKSELTNDDIKQLFDVSDSYLQKIKKPVKQKMAEQGVKSWLPRSINTKVAYDVWEIDIADYEARLKKLQSLKAKGVLA